MRYERSVSLDLQVERELDNVDKIRQLTSNIVEDSKRDETTPVAHGILFGNGFRLTSPTSRNVGFTEKCITMAKSNTVALIHTADLFVVAKYVKDSGDDGFAAKCRASIRSGLGSIVRFPPLPAE